MSELLYIKSAQMSVNGFTSLVDDELILESNRAVDCMDCEALLLVGIQAFDGISRVDECIREAVFAKKITVDEKFDDAILRLYKAWMIPTANAIRWAETCKDHGFDVANLEEFMRCVEEAQSIIGSNFSKSSAIRQLEQEAIEEYRSGKTAEFFSE